MSIPIDVMIVRATATARPWVTLVEIYAKENRIGAHEAAQKLSKALPEFYAAHVWK